MVNESDMLQQLEELEYFKKRTQATTMIEFLGLCGTLFASFSLEDDKSRTTKGDLTSPEGRCRPTRILESTGMSGRRNDALARLEKALQDGNGESKRIFPSLVRFEHWKADLHVRGKIGTEDELTIFYHNAAETPLLELFNAAKQVPKCRTELQMDQDKIEISGRTPQRPLDPKPVESPHSKEYQIPQNYCDRKCFSTKDGKEQLVFLMEVKPPHKLPKEILERGLLGIRGTDNLQDFIVHCEILTGDAEDKAKKIVLTALTQAYDYMLKAGTQLGCLVTGEAILFLELEGIDSQTLCYDLVIPYRPVDDPATSGGEVYRHDNDNRKYRQTDVGQLFGLFLMAHKTLPRLDDARWKVEKALKWKVTDEEKVAHRDYRDNPPMADKSSKKDSSYRGSGTGGSCGESVANRTRSSKKDDDDENGPNKRLKQNEHSLAGTGSQEGNQTQGSGTTGSAKGGKAPADGQERQSYCSHECLLGLKHSLPLDKKCPNYEQHLHPTNILVENGRGIQRWLLAPSVDVSVADHVSTIRMPTKAMDIADCNGRIDDNRYEQTSSKGKTTFQQQETYHTIDLSTFLSLLRTQLRHTLEQGLTNTMKTGSRGRIFQVTLLTHGYTLVGKATHSGWIPNLKHEEFVYQRLEPLQGRFVPVCFGGLGGWGPFWDFDVGLEWMCLVSWAGLNVLEAERAKVAPPSAQLDHMRAHILNQIRALGIEHGDDDWQNFLWDGNRGKSEPGGVMAPGTLMVCDFERATVKDVEVEKESFPRVTPEGREGSEEETGKEPEFPIDSDHQQVQGDEYFGAYKSPPSPTYVESSDGSSDEDRTMNYSEAPVTLARGFGSFTHISVGLDGTDKAPSSQANERQIGNKGPFTTDSYQHRTQNKESGH